MFILVKITYKVLSVTNIAVEKEDATLDFVRILKYFVGSNCITMRYKGNIL